MRSQLGLSINTIMKSKKVDESDFRVHFTLLDVSWHGNENQLIEELASRIKKDFKPHIIQIVEGIENNKCDVTVGLFNDIEAYEYVFIKKKRGITITDKNGKEGTYFPVISRVFQSYMKKMAKKLDPLIVIAEPEPVLKKNESVYSKKSQGRVNNCKEGESLGAVGELPESKREIEKREEKTIDRIWAFGIPSQFKCLDICKQLANKGIQVYEYEDETGRNGKFSSYLSMEYLELNLKTPLTKQQIYALHPTVDNYPYLIIPAMPNPHEILNQISKFTIELLVKEEYDRERDIIMMMNRIGGVNIMLRYENTRTDQIKYILVFNNVENIERALTSMKREMKTKFHYRKPYPHFQVGRLLTYYTFEGLLSEIDEY